MGRTLRVEAPGDVRLQRDEHGVVHVEAAAETDRYWGMGYCHALDRALQMLMMRVLGQGRAAELLDGSDEMVAVDRFFRRMDWAGETAGQAEALSEDARRLVDAYCAGVNARLSRKVPWELRLLGLRPEPWTLDDTVLVSRMAGYLTLAQSQAEVERLLVEMVQAGVRRELLDELFPGLLGELDEGLLRQVRLGERIVPEGLRWLAGTAPALASNNWVVAGSRTASGAPLLANDPHLEVNRLPNVWYELVLRWPEGYAVAATMPGLPALLVGRTAELAWGVTYTFMDAIDSWVEHCRDGCYRRGDEWLPFSERHETIERKKGAPVEVVFHENEHGVLDGAPHEEGHLLATRWASSRAGAASLEAGIGMGRARTVEEGMALLGRIESAFNWVLADGEGNIGYQMSGLLPRRRAGVSGLVPLPGWLPDNDWQGFVPPEELPRCLNPDEGFIVTANQDLNHLGVADPINMPMGAYRADRIAARLAEEEAVDVEHARRLQLETFSIQAEAFLEVLRPLLPDDEPGRILREWDCEYDADSVGATLFEAFYGALLADVFGGTAFGDEVVRFLQDETGVFIDFYGRLDPILLAGESAWFSGEPREAFYRRALGVALAADPVPWGRRQQITMAHMLFGGKLPRWLGFDRGPLPLLGGRATVRQGQVYRSAGRTTSFGPSMRVVIDLAEEGSHTALAGGPSDRRFSRWYCSGLAGWQAGELKRLTAG